MARVKGPMRVEDEEAEAAVLIEIEVERLSVGLEGVEARLGTSLIENLFSCLQRFVAAC